MSIYDWWTLALVLMVLLSIACRSVLFTLGLALVAASVVVATYAPLAWFGNDPFVVGVVLTALVGAVMAIGANRALDD